MRMAALTLGLLLCLLAVGALAHTCDTALLDGNGMLGPRRTLEANFSCGWLQSTGGLPPQCCCGPVGNVTRCLPRVIIAGTQKSGSTALFGYFAMHPQFSPPKQNKELHLLEMDGYWSDDKEGLSRYLDLFHPANASMVTGEATPSYFGGWSASERIARLIPRVKVIVMLRHPVDRFYSEYQMKWRRVHQQVNLTRDGPALRAAYHRCTTLHAPRASPAITRKKGDAELRALALAHRPAQPAPEEQRNKRESQVVRLSPRVRSRVFNATAWRMCMRTHTDSVPSVVFHIGKWSNMASWGYLGGHDRCLVNVTGGVNGTTLPTWPALTKCYKHPWLRFEAVESIENVTATELEVMRPCESGTGFASLLGGELVQAPLLTWGTEQCWKSGVSSDISKNFGFRGVYYPQLVRYLQFLPKEDVLVLEDRELRNDPVATMNTVWKFTGLSPLDVTNITKGDVYKKFTSLYPLFEERTGWRMDSEYTALPLHLRQQLLEFYRPHNEQLFTFLGRRFEHWDK